jgi:hypothetical protein
MAPGSGYGTTGAMAGAAIRTALRPDTALATALSTRIISAENPASGAAIVAPKPEFSPGERLFAQCVIQMLPRRENVGVNALFKLQPLADPGYRKVVRGVKMHGYGKASSGRGLASGRHRALHRVPWSRASNWRLACSLVYWGLPRYC